MLCQIENEQTGISECRMSGGSVADLFGFFDVDPTDRMSVSIWNNAFSGVSIHSEDLSCHHRGVQWPGQLM